MRLNKLTGYTKKDCFIEYLNGVNTTRKNYIFSTHTYDADNISNVYLIEHSRQILGFVDCEYQDTDITFTGNIHLFIGGLHIAPSMQNKGVGKAVIEHLLSKGVDLKMVVVKENLNILKLVKKFDYIELYTTKNTFTMVLPSKNA